MLGDNHNVMDATTLELLDEACRKMTDSAHLQGQNADITKDFADPVSQSRICRRSRREEPSACSLCFPPGEFTIQYLEHVNPTIAPTTVRVELAAAIATGQVLFIERDENRFGLSKTITYQKR